MTGHGHTHTHGDDDQAPGGVAWSVLDAIVVGCVVGLAALFAEWLVREYRARRAPVPAARGPLVDLDALAKWGQGDPDPDRAGDDQP